MIINNHLHKKGFAPALVLKQRLAASQKWPIEILFQSLQFNEGDDDDDDGLGVMSIELHREKKGI